MELAGHASAARLAAGDRDPAGADPDGKKKSTKQSGALPARRECPPEP
jgi:hypothetical protein